MFAVTTRNKLRSRRYALNMIWAWWHVRRQLKRTPGMLAYTTGIATLTEFYTLTLWEKEIDMIMFMSSDDHRDMMWNFRRWSDSFWSMQWHPTNDEVGAWNGKSFRKPLDHPESMPPYVGPGYLAPDQVPESLKPCLDRITRRAGPETLEVNAVIGRIVTRSPASIRRLKRLLHPWRSARNTLRYSLAVGPGECLLLAVWREGGVEESQAMLRAIMNRFPDAWAMRFHATDFEVGHWNQQRLREL